MVVHNVSTQQYPFSCQDAPVLMKTIWWVDDVYAVRSDYKSQSGSVMSMGHGMFAFMQIKQAIYHRE
jgi:hypothetical protein